MDGLDSDVIHIISNSPNFDPDLTSRKKIFDNLVEKGYVRNQIVGADEKLTLDIQTAILRKIPFNVQIFRIRLDALTGQYTGQYTGYGKFPGFTGGVLHTGLYNLDHRFGQSVTLYFEPEVRDAINDRDVIQVTKYSMIRGDSVKVIEFVKI